ncbi:MAG: hypothetical protein IJ679_04155 [Lachnospiraceae bacterium]|nr:hypothetical protein [Lachnospiraceae bacterium]
MQNKEMPQRTKKILLGSGIAVLCLLLAAAVIPAKDKAKIEETSVAEEDVYAAKEPASLPIPSLKSMLADEEGGITLTWEAVENAAWYEIQRAEKGSAKYKNIAAVKVVSYRDATGTPGTTYSYRVRAAAQNGKSDYCGDWEKTCRKNPERIAYVGDSVMSGFEAYGVLSEPREASFAQVSRTIEMIDQQDLPGILAYQPDRVYMMVGTNDCVGNPADEQMDPLLVSYYDMVDKLHAGNPAVEIVVMGIGPTRSDKVTSDTVARFNNKLQKLVGERDFAYYYDTGKLLRDGEGNLREDYAASDGIHWSKAAYEAVYPDLHQFVKQW